MRIQILGSHVAEGFTQHLEAAFRELGHEVRVIDYFPLSSGTRTVGLQTGAAGATGGPEDRA